MTLPVEHIIHLRIGICVMGFLLALVTSVCGGGLIRDDLASWSRDYGTIVAGGLLCLLGVGFLALTFFLLSLLGVGAA